MQSRLRRRAASEDVVQETFIGFLTSLPNYDTRRPLESWLFSIAAHKLTDYLRREGRRPAIPLSTGDDSSGAWEPAGNARGASSIARSGERRGLEDEAVADGIRQQIDRWRDKATGRRFNAWNCSSSSGWAIRRLPASWNSASSKWPISNSISSSGFATLSARRRLSEDMFPELYE